MQLKLRNKHLLGLEKILQEGKNLGGVPSHFELHPSEGYELLREINDLYMSKAKATILTPIKIEQVKVHDGWFENGTLSPGVVKDTATLAVFSKTDRFTRKVGEQLVQQWFNGEFKIRYNSIELRIIPKSQPVKQITGNVITGDTGNVTAIKHHQNPPDKR